MYGGAAAAVDAQCWQILLRMVPVPVGSLRMVPLLVVSVRVVPLLVVPVRVL